MRLACSSLLFTRRPFACACAEIAALGCDAIDVGVMEGWAHFNPSELVQDLATGVAQAQAGMAPYGLTPMALNANAGTEEPGEEQRRVAALCDFAQCLEVPVICYSAPPSQHALAAQIERYRPLLALAQERALTFTLETHVGTLLERPDVAVRFCEALPGLGLTLDPSHLVCGPHQGRPFPSLFPLVRHVHLRDAGSTPAAMQVPFGKGQVDFRGLLNDLRTAGYDGGLALEYIDSLAETDAVASARALKGYVEAILEQEDR